MDGFSCMAQLGRRLLAQWEPAQSDAECEYNFPGCNPQARQARRLQPVTSPPVAQAEAD
ncbi:hypothetical protein [Variovorax sp. dw_954]|uniref:hypothetical protein n=2 Tax=unclassified Variovorax TaxID=663243 RepID=UPI001BD223F3|nr:hypothetical protein [Variovorax sp. dw_954]